MGAAFIVRAFSFWNVHGFLHARQILIIQAMGIPVVSLTPWMKRRPDWRIQWIHFIRAAMTAESGYGNSAGFPRYPSRWGYRFHHRSGGNGHRFRCLHPRYFRWKCHPTGYHFRFADSGFTLDMTKSFQDTGFEDSGVVLDTGGDDGTIKWYR